MTQGLYNLFLFFYQIGITIFALRNHKAKRWVTGRKNILEKISSELSKNYTGHTTWMHCASLGEFEQGRPLLEQIRITNPSSRIIITFFSPSGYEIRKDYIGADHVFYLPMDSSRNARIFVELINPTLVLWIKYEYWYYYLGELKRRNIPTLLISGSFRKSQRFFSSYGGFWRNILLCFTHLFLQNRASADLLSEINISEKVTISGDTRFDRVINIAENFIDVPGVSGFCKDHQVVVAGSTWEEDEAIFVHYVKANPNKVFIIAPHEIDHENLQDIKKEFPNSLFYSQIINSNKSSNTMDPEVNVLIIDSIGLLSRLYKYADVTYVGGGFGDDGLHNILEAAVYGKPVVFGPEIDKNVEAQDMIDTGGAVCIENAVELEIALNEMMNNDVELKLKGNAAKEFIYGSAGATNEIMTYLQENNLLPSGKAPFH